MHSAGEARLSTGIPGLDEVLHGGLLPGRAYLVCGGPGTGKTILGLHFLCQGARRSENVLLITLEEKQENLYADGARIGLNLEKVNFLDLSPESGYFSEVQSYDIFLPAEVGRQPITNKITETVERLQPTRIFLDPLTQFRYLATDIF